LRGTDVDDKDKKILDWAEFVATKFSGNAEGWVYSRDTGDLKHIRYESDYTGRNHWTKRLRRALDLKHLLGRDSFSKTFRQSKRSIRDELLTAAAWFSVNWRKDSHLPDGQINGIITHWEEDGEYIALFQPRVGVKVLDFIRNNPESPYAQAILSEMRACADLSFPAEEEE
jgi:hypothetical protein